MSAQVLAMFCFLIGVLVARVCSFVNIPGLPAAAAAAGNTWSKSLPCREHDFQVCGGEIWQPCFLKVPHILPLLYFLLLLLLLYLQFLLAILTTVAISRAVCDESF